MKTVTLEEKLRRKTQGIVILNAVRGFSFALLGASAAVYALFVLYFSSNLLPFHISKVVLLDILAGLPLLIALATMIRERKNMWRLTLALERHYPQLQDRLLTAVEFSKRNRQAHVHPFSQILAKSLEEEVTVLMDKFGFGRAASPRKLILPAGFLLLLSLTAIVHAMVQPDFFVRSYQRMTGSQRSGMIERGMLGEKKPPFEIQVIPGHCEIGKGSNLLIQALVSGTQAEYAELSVKQDRDSTWQIFPMNRVKENTFQFLLTHITEPNTYRIRINDQESPHFQIRLYEPFMIEKVFWSIEFPEYLGLLEQRRQGWKEKMTVPRGTQLHLKLVTNRDVKTGWVLAGTENRFPLTPSSPNELETSVTASEDLILRLDIQDTVGEPLLGVPSLWIQTLPDLPPYLEVSEPQEHNFVFPTQEIPFEINANDDYGLRSVTLVLHYQGREERVEWLPQDKRVDHVALKPIFDLERLKLRSRDFVFAYIEVRDYYPGQPDHVIYSPLLTFLIRDYVEQFKTQSPPPDHPSLRILFEDVLVDQEKLTQETWDYLSRYPFEGPTGWEEEAKPS